MGRKTQDFISSAFGLSTILARGGTENTAYDALGLKIKSKSVVEQECVNFGTDLLRQKVPTEFDSIKIGEYFYYVTGAPGQCSEHDSDLKLQEAILNDLRVENIESI